MTDEQSGARFIPPYSVRFDGMTWPLAGGAIGDLEWRLRYGVASRNDLLVAASVLSAYMALVNRTERDRRLIIRALRAVRTT